MPRASLKMNKTVTFVSLFRNVNPETKQITWGASFKVDNTDIGASHLPKFDLSLFKPMVSKDGKTKYLGSKRPVLVEYSDIRAGKKEGKFFTNIVSISEQPEADNSELDAMLDDETAEAEQSTEAPQTQVTDF